MKIWLSPSAFFPARGGVEELTLQLARQYRLRGHEVTVVVHRHPQALPREDSIEGIAVHRVPFDLPGSQLGALARYPFTLSAQVRQLRSLSPRPDVIHIQCPSNQVPAVSLFAQTHRIPLVITTQGEVTMDANAIYQHSTQMRLSLKAGSHAAASLTACSRRAREDAAAVAPRFAGSTVIPNGVDPSQWQVTPLPAEPSIAAWGRHVPQKGFDLLLAAFAQLRDERSDVVLRLGGEGPETARLQAAAGNGVEFVGPLDRQGVQALLARSRLAVVPSRLEPFGIVAVEAMAAGRGVVWSTNGGLADATGGLGWGVDPSDRTALAGAMSQALDRPLRQADVRAHAERLSWARIADQYLRLYRAATRHRMTHS